MDRDRLRRIRNWQSDDWYAALLLRPVCILVMLLIADWRWLTPNRLTTAANLCKLVSAALILPGAGPAVGLGDGAAVWLAVVGLQLGGLFDNLDGTVARYRRSFSALGSFYDKTGDIVTWFLISAALGWRAYAATGDALVIVLAMASAHALAVRGYMKWLVIAESERLRWHEAAGDPAAAVSRRTAPPRFSEPPHRSAADWVRWLARMLLQVYRFEEIDLIFWVSLGLVLDRVTELCWLLFISQTLGLIGLIGYRAWEAHRLDVALAPHRR